MFFHRRFFLRSLFFTSSDYRRTNPLHRRKRRWSKVLNKGYFSKFKRLSDLFKFLRLNLFEGLGKVERKRGVPRFFIKSRFTVNNYFLTLVNPKGEVLLWYSSGRAGFIHTSTKRKGYALEKVGKHFAFLVKQKVGSCECAFIVESKFNYKLRGLLWHLRKAKVKLVSFFWRPRIGHNGLRLVRQRRY